MKGQFKMSSWGDAETYASVSNSVAGSKAGAAQADPGQNSTYLDLAAASEAEALQQRKSAQNNNDMENQDALDLPTSDFGIGRRA